MSHKQLYRQCKLQRENVQQTTWLPSKYAKVGRTLSLRQPDETWSDGWEVIEAYEGTRTIDEMEAQRDAHKRWESVIK